MHKKNVVITGASRGIGRACAETFARNGYNVALCCRNQMERLISLAAELETKYPIETVCYQGDAGSYRDMEAFISRTHDALGDIGILINNAGISITGLLTDMTPDQWNEILSSNLSSVFNTCRLVVPEMVARKEGCILNISSVWGSVGASCEVAYSATKGGVDAFTKALAKELAPSGIAVNALACGAVDTDMNAVYSEEERKALEYEIPAGRFATPQEVAEAALTLAESGKYLTGQVIRFDGAWI